MKLITFETDYICVAESDPSTSPTIYFATMKQQKDFYNLMKQYT